MNLNCYKVVRRHNDKLYSTSSYSYTDLESDWIVEYKQGRKVRAKVKGASLYVFKTYAAAKRFVEAEGGCEVWSCTVENPTPIVLAYSSMRSTLQEFWRLKLANKKYSALKRTLTSDSYLKNGLCVSSVKLIERIS